MSTVGKSTPDMVDDLMRRAREISRPPRHVYRLFVYFISERSRIAESYQYIAHSPDHASDVLQATAAIEPTNLAEADGRTGMIQALTTAFLDATERVKRETEWGDVYAADAKHDDHAFAESSAFEAGSRWHKAT